MGPTRRLRNVAAALEVRQEQPGKGILSVINSPGSRGEYPLDPGAAVDELFAEYELSSPTLLLHMNSLN